MKVGLQVNRFTWEGQPQSIAEKLAKIVTTADTSGYSSLWVMDHFFQIGHIGKPEEPMLEAYTTLGYIAGLTKKITLGTMVTGVIYRHPALLIKAVTTLDVLSQGRAYLGIGAAWNEEESLALGFPFPPLKERFERLEETLLFAKQMWSGDEKPFEGKYMDATRPLNSPQVISKPHPPILIGGGGEQKTLKLVAKYANASNLFAADMEILAHKLEILKGHCKEIGRNFEEIEITVLDRLPDELNTAAVIEKCKKLREMGVNHVIFQNPHIDTTNLVAEIGEKIIPQVASL
jgi:F420-dependent oxidoreductase-like protein